MKFVETVSVCRGAQPARFTRHGAAKQIKGCAPFSRSLFKTTKTGGRTMRYFHPVQKTSPRIADFSGRTPQNSLNWKKYIGTYIHEFAKGRKKEDENRCVEKNESDLGERIPRVPNLSTFRGSDFLFSVIRFCQRYCKAVDADISFRRYAFRCDLRLHETVLSRCLDYIQSDPCSATYL